MPESIKFFKGVSTNILPPVDGQIVFTTDKQNLFLDVDEERYHVNPQADWAETDDESHSFIKNKPDLDSLEVVKYSESQTLTDAEKTQARTNIGAASSSDIPTDVVTYASAQSLTDAQKAQARENIGVSTTGISTGTVKYDSEQSLTDTQKTTARNNIDAPSVSDVNSLLEKEIVFGFTINDEGHLIQTVQRYDSSDIQFSLEEGRLMVSYA